MMRFLLEWSGVAALLIAVALLAVALAFAKAVVDVMRDDGSDDL